jgi:hypothetical protein
MIEHKFHPAQPWPVGWFWWLRNGDSWSAPDINNGAPYLPGRPQWWRQVCWIFRNPIGNFVGFIVGVGGYDYTAIGPVPVDLTTWYDAVPPQYGWKWSVLQCGWLYLPFISYSGKRVLWYFGWRAYSGGLGFKLNFHA